MAIEKENPIRFQGMIRGVPMYGVDRLGDAPTSDEPIVFVEPRDLNPELWDEIFGESDSEKF